MSVDREEVRSVKIDSGQNKVGSNVALVSVTRSITTLKSILEIQWTNKFGIQMVQTCSIRSGLEF